MQVKKVRKQHINCTFLLVQERYQRTHKLSFPKESLIKEKLQLRTFQKLRLFPRKSTITPDTSQTVSDSLHKTQCSHQVKGQF